MGVLNSTPIVSQIKSLIQIIYGDDDGARKTQEDFLRTWWVVSQIDLLVRSIKKDNKEVLKIQQQAGDECLKLTESTSVIDHAGTGGYSIAVDLDKEEDRSIAVPSSSAATTELSFSCDGVASAITGDNR